jgi:alkaline phosphatase D
MKNFLLLFLAASFFAASAQDHLSSSRSLIDPSLAPFYHGVASGDPLSDRVILWTRVTTQNPTENVDWQIATDTTFSTVINSGTVATDATVDYTVKVDATGLQPGTWYYYRFKNNGNYSLTGRTKTAPVGDMDSLRFAIVACSNYQAGYFNAYKDIAVRNDVDAVVHLGDYYYEYEAGGYGYINDTSRLHEPANEILSLADYRKRNSQYKLDPDLRYCHQMFPFITIWDDHETANNSWYGGAENHQPATEGDWFVRKAVAKQAYFEWIPIRELSPGNDTIIHRTLPWSNLMDFIMLDTRYEGRDSSLGTAISTSNSTVTNPTRSMLGAFQLQWFKDQLSNSTAKWKIIGNQVMIAPLTAFGLVLNGDQWDGYPVERKKILDHIMQNNLHDIVFLTGDIHSSWGNDLPHPDSTYSASTGHGSVATEFVCTSITSPALDALNGVPSSVVTTINPYMKYVEYTKHGYLLLDVNKQRVQGDWIYMSTLLNRNYTASDAAHWMNLDTERFLRQASSPLGPRPGMPGLLPYVSAVREANKDNMVMLGCYPNPTVNEVALQYYLYEPAKVELKITDLNGRVVYTATEKQSQTGLFNTEANISNLFSGTYIVSLSTGKSLVSKQIVVAK